MTKEKPKILIFKGNLIISKENTEDIAEKNIKNKLKKEILEDIKQGLLLEISKKEKDTYTYFSKNTLSTLLFLSKTNISYPFPLENLMDKNDFAEFYYDLDYTDLKAVFWININNRRENLYKHYETFLEHQGQIEGKILDVERTMPVELLNLFYDNIKDCDIGLYSTEESLFQYFLFEKYNIKKSKKRRTEKEVKDYGLYNFISYEPKFVSNQIADDILKEYIDEFENCKLNEDRRTPIINPYTEEELTEIDKIDKSKLTEEEKNKRLAKFSQKEIYADICRTLLKKEQRTNYYSYKKLITMVADIFGSDYENSGNILNVNNGIFLNNKKFSEDDVEKIRLYELLLSLEKNKDIKINRITCKNCEFSVNIEFLKNPKDINKDTENWITYGDLKVNKDLGLVQYKNKPIKKFTKSSSKFKVLCYLAEHPDIVVHVKKLVEISKLKKDFKGYKKAGRPSKEIQAKIIEDLDLYLDKIKGYMIDAQEELGILDDKKRTIQITQSKPGFILHKI